MSTLNVWTRALTLGDVCVRAMLAYTCIHMPGCGVDPEARSGECSGQLCDREKWVIVNFDGLTVWPDAPDHPCQQFYSVDFAREVPQNFIVSGSANAARGLELAMVTQDGLLHVCDFGSSAARVSLDIGALGVAWSNAGDRLAVVRRDGSGGHVLEIWSPELDVLDAVEVTLPEQPAELEIWRALVSWSASDALVAVSSTGGELGTDTQIAEPGQIVEATSGRVYPVAYSRIFFIGETEWVGQPLSCPGSTGNCVRILEFDGERVVQLGALEASASVLRSHPPTGVMMTIEPSPTAPFGLVVGFTSLRTIERGPAMVYQGPSSLDVTLIPVEDARAALEAAGFGPDACDSDD